MSDDVYISNFVNVKPPAELGQEQSILWLMNRHLEQSQPQQQGMIKKRFHYYSIKKDKISKRSFAVQELLKVNSADLSIYSHANSDDISYKTDFFAKYSWEIVNKLYPNKDSLPEHMLHITCTGYVSPSAPQILVGKFAAKTKVTHAYHMGCYASLPAIRSAAGLLRSNDSKTVDLIHTEACSLHMDARTHTPEQVVIQTLFADGNIKYSLCKTKPNRPSFELLCQKELIIPNTHEDMRWEVKRWGFAMTLSRCVPEKIKAALNDFMEELAGEARLCKEELFRRATFAVHPGGPKIINAVAQQFDLREEQIKFSEKVLFERGNMSSATLPHVWEEITKSDHSDGHIVVSLAFGPGLSIFGSVFRFRR